MGKVTKMEKVEMLIGAAVAASSYDDIMKEEGSADVRKELMSHFTEVCVMFVADYYTDGDTNKASEFMADNASKALSMCERRAKAKRGKDDNGITQEELEKALGKEAADKLKRLLQDND